MGDLIEDSNIKQSETYGQILNTKFHYDIPYVVDVEKYKTTVNGFHDVYSEHMPTRLTDENAKTLCINCEWEEDESRYVMFIWVQGQVNNEDWHYDCFIFHDVDKEYFNQCLIDVTKCFIKIDEDAVKDLKKGLNKTKSEIERNMNIIDNIVFNFEG